VRKKPKSPSPQFLKDLSEEVLLSLLAKPLPQLGRASVGIGDDCAVLDGYQGKQLLLKTDALVEGIHFLPGQSGRDAGWKALCRPLSDIAAMGGEPLVALVTFATSEKTPLSWWQDFYRGLGRASKQFQVEIVGGETTRSLGGIFVSVTVVGWVHRPVLRSAGRPGDCLFVTGRLGGSFVSGRHLRFCPRLIEGRWLADQTGIGAMMDLSDGLGSDLPRLAAASGVGYAVEPGKLPRHRGCTVSQAISDGEDYELLFSVRAKAASALKIRWKKKFPKVPLTEIGRLTKEGQTPLPSGYQIW